MRSRGIAGLVAMLVTGLFFAVVSALEGTSVSTAHLMTFAIATVFAGVAVERFADHPRELLELDKLFIFTVGAYTVLPMLVGCFFPGIGFDDYLQKPALWCTLLAIAGFGLGFMIAPTRLITRMLPARDLPWREGEASLFGSAFIAVGVVLLVILVQQVGVSTYFQSDYVDAYAAESGLGYLVAGLFLAEVGIFTYFLAKSTNGKRPIVPLVVAALFAVVSLRAGRRRFALETGMGLIALQHFTVKPIRLRTVLFGLALVVPLFTVIGQARSALAQGWDGMRTYALYEFSSDQWLHALDDFHTVPLSLVTTTNFIPEREPYRLGKTYLQAFEVLIPLKLYPNRPLTPAQWMVWSSEDSFAAAGGGRSFSHIAEAYMNFSYLGVFLFCFLQAILVKTAVEYRRDAPNSATRALLYVCGLTTVITLVRGDFASWLKTTFIMLGAALPIGMWLGSYRESRNFRADPQLAPLSAAPDWRR